ncbi:MAG: helix-turn-helix transcriptional regulator [Bacilli bacterium]|nr:helix-turn-helix domain-containing protein [Mycoplasmatota bacterium]MDD6941933.1 helix-turn-helix transcriptional regulator [bacterium]MDY2696918.1 helix-turn-helix transcriptional regulator [Bacilli bacterium]MEE0014545.1 helix-turn-helix transcriptional regulator [Bacilli bacterium]
MKELGDYLKRTRISNGVSIAEAAEDLDLSTVQLENIESGNVKAFKDVYALKEDVRQYAKYLGLNPEKVIDEFNGFLFEHTSKISLEDIKMAQKKMEEEEKGATSPYTKEYKKKVGPWPFIIAILLIVFIFIILYLIISTINKAPERTTELMSKERGNVIYEFA